MSALLMDVPGLPSRNPPVPGPLQMVSSPAAGRSMVSNGASSRNTSMRVTCDFAAHRLVHNRSSNAPCRYLLFVNAGTERSMSNDPRFQPIVLGPTPRFDQECVRDVKSDRSHFTLRRFQTGAGPV